MPDGLKGIDRPTIEKTFVEQPASTPRDRRNLEERRSSHRHKAGCSEITAANWHRDAGREPVDVLAFTEPGRSDKQMSLG